MTSSGPPSNPSPEQKGSRHDPRPLSTKTFNLIVVVLVVVVPLDALVWATVVGIIIVLVAVVLVIHIACALPSLLLNALLVFVPIPRVPSLGLSKPVDLRANDAHQSLFGECVVDRFTLLALVVFKELESLKANSAGSQFVRELALIVELLVILLGIVKPTHFDRMIDREEGDSGLKEF